MTNLTLITTIQAVLNAYDTATLPHFRTSQLNLSQKYDDTPVTLADTNAEKEARRIISSHHPSHPIWGEEMGWGLSSPPTPSSATPVLWVLDPIDGTRSFATGNPLFGCMVGILQQEKTPPKAPPKAILSAISFPALNEHTFSHNSPHRTSSCKQLSHARLAATSHVLFNPQEWEQFSSVSRHVALTRFGGDCYNYVSLAAGWLDIVIEADMAVHDIIPLIPIVQNAGGSISDWNGQPLDQQPLHQLFHPLKKYQVIASATPQLHDQALSQLHKI